MSKREGGLSAPKELFDRDLGKVLLKLEELQAVHLEKELEPKVKAPEISKEGRGEALDLLIDPILIARILEDFGRCGVIGKETKKLKGYLAALSRKLSKALWVMIQSSSADKSSLIGAWKKTKTKRPLF